MADKGTLTVTNPLQIQFIHGQTAQFLAGIGAAIEGIEIKIAQDKGKPVPESVRHMLQDRKDMQRIIRELMQNIEQSCGEHIKHVPKQQASPIILQ